MIAPTQPPQEFRPEGPSEMLSAANLMFHCTWGCREISLNLGLDVEVAFIGVESGIYEVWQRLSTGRLKVFRSMSNWLYEFRLYRRDEKGRIVKENDHLMDATRYLVMSGLDRAKVKPVEETRTSQIDYYSGYSQGWMG